MKKKLILSLIIISIIVYFLPMYFGALPGYVYVNFGLFIMSIENLWSVFYLLLAIVMALPLISSICMLILLLKNKIKGVKVFSIISFIFYLIRCLFKGVIMDNLFLLIPLIFSLILCLMIFICYREEDKNLLSE